MNTYRQYDQKYNPIESRDLENSVFTGIFWDDFPFSLYFSQCRVYKSKIELWRKRGARPAVLRKAKNRAGYDFLSDKAARLWERTRHNKGFTEYTNKTGFN